MTASGGVATAAGLGFQYLATVETLLDWLDCGEDFELTTEDSSNSVIDFSISSAGRLLMAVQAKASVDGPAGRAMEPAEILAVATRLIETPADQYVLRTNRRLSSDSVKLLDAIARISTDHSAQEIRASIGTALRTGANGAMASVDDVALPRIARFCVQVTETTNEVLSQHVADRILALRRQQSRGIGRDSAQVLLGYLVTEVLYRSGRRTGRTLARRDAITLLGFPERVVAYAMGRYHWGHRFGPFPSLRVLGRPEYLDAITTHLATMPEDRSPRMTALLGISGVGKTSIVASYCVMTAPRYDTMLWLDASSDGAMRQQLSEWLGIRDRQASIGEVARLFRERVGGSPESTLLVFDNADSATHLAPWLPSQGHVDVIATSTDATAWNQWHRVNVTAMERADAVELVRLRLQLDTLTADGRANAERLVEAVDRWPLAIELACAFLVQSGRGLAVTDDYLRLLSAKSIDDARLMPSEYRSHPTLLHAVLVALDVVEAEAPRSAGLAGHALLQVLSYVPPRSAPLDLAGRVAICLENVRGRWPGALPETDDEVALVIDQAVRQLSTASLVERLDGNDPLGARCRTNAVVLDVVRQLHGDEDRASTLGLLQLVADEKLRSALDEERFLEANALAPTAAKIVEHSTHYGIYARHGITLMGNLAGYFQVRGDHFEARNAFGQELRTLEACELQAPLLEAKIHTGVALSSLYLNENTEAISAALDAALDAAENAVSAGGDFQNALETTAQQMFEIIETLQRSRTFTSSDAIENWRGRTVHLFPSLERDQVVRQIGRELDDPGNDDAATLRRVDAELATDMTFLRRVDLLCLRGETLTSLGDMDAAAQSFRGAVDALRAQSMGLGPAWTTLLNGWRNAVLTLLGRQGDLSPTLRLCRALEQMTGDEAPLSPDDRAVLSLCRAASNAETAPINVAEALVANLDDSLFEATHLVRDQVATLAAVNACQRIVALRRRVGGAPILPVHGWSKGHLAHGLPWLVLSTAGELVPSHLRGRASTAPMLGRWVVSDDGIGARVGDSDAIAWLPLQSTGWLTFADAKDHPAARRLHGLATDPDESRVMRVVVLTETPADSVSVDDIMDGVAILPTGLDIV